MEHFNIAIDGPAGAGKSTIAKLAAKRLGFVYVDTGAMYRTIALHILREGIDPQDEAAVSATCRNVNVTIAYKDGVQQVLLNGENVSGLIRAEEVGKTASATSGYLSVREKLVELQKELAKRENVIMDGRDIGTCVLPDAPAKIYLTASVKVRAERRYKELTEKGIDADLREIERDIESRDYQDMFDDYSSNKQNQTREKRDALLFVKQKLDAAQWFGNAVKQRQETLLSTIKVIVDLQKDFFLTGDERNLKPMILKDVAERAGYDISTISRASNSKYVQTNFGIYPLKYFFSESMQNEAGEEVSTREIKRLLEELVDHEDKHKPLSDDKLCELLQQKGYPIARRTIAKYREQLSIPVARLRKEI